MYQTRFAPSPTGYLHLGHAVSALFAWHLSGKQAARPGGTQPGFILRVEDIDYTRCRAPYIQALYEDLKWLGIVWEEPVLYQSTQLQRYQKALEQLKARGLLYPCFCSRKQIKTDVENIFAAPHLSLNFHQRSDEPGSQGPDGPIYSGRCAVLTPLQQKEQLERNIPYAWRLDMKKACQQAGKLTWQDRIQGKQEARPQIFGDIVLARKDIATSYHLAVCLDDAYQKITCVTRGQDLFQATHIHCLLQALLALPTPEYIHHPLVYDVEGQRLAKRYKSRSLREMRHSGQTVEKDVMPLFTNLFEDILRSILIR